jgi:metal-dependent amidase/aminoacylase/carboxypeptidase family protein
MQEFETSGLMIEMLEKAGFAIERNLSGMPTGFAASYGSENRLSLFTRSLTQRRPAPRNRA